jgi:mannose-6-phosphate isomerase-like protein (cupin superfamily)
MQPIKYSPNQTTRIDLGTKVIFKYPTPTQLFDIARMVVAGRHPADPNKYILEHACDFVIYVIRGEGKVWAGEEIFEVKVNDVVFVPKENKFAVEGNMEYITVDVPAFSLEQSEEIEAT